MDPNEVATAASRVSGVVNRTPVMQSRRLNAQLGADIFFKCENFQRVGAFKFRGAYHALSQLSESQRKTGVTTHSSGNHAQGVALAAQLLGAPATIVMPDNAPQVKVDATAAYGAEIVRVPAAEREEKSAALAQAHGYTLIHPYDDTNVILGQGTAAWELFDEVGDLELLFTPVGGGGLISGTALAAAVRSPGCKVIGVEPISGDDACRSWRSGKVVTLDHVPNTIADGVRTRFVGEKNLAVMRRFVADMFTADDEAILETMQYLWTRLKLFVEPSSALAFAPAFTGNYDISGRRVGVILSGGNVDIPNFKRLFS